MKLLKNNCLAESFLCYITKQILNGIKYMHINKIAHFDIKPKNLVIDDFLNIKIIDFSISLNYKNKKSNKIKLPFRGTDFYIPPEVDKKEIISIEYLNKIDLFSLDVTLYNLAFDRYPYELSYEESKHYKYIIKQKDKKLVILSFFMIFY